MVIRVPLNLVTHKQRIASLYKTWLRYIQGNAKTIEEYRYKAVLAREDFETMYYEKDMRRSKELLLEKEAELSNFPSPPICFPYSPGGPAFLRNEWKSDHLVDLWHPLEKAIFPTYFATRELRKMQYIEMWERLNGPPPPEEDEE